MSKYIYEQKLEVVAAITEKGLTFQTAADIIWVSKGAAKKWVKVIPIEELRCEFKLNDLLLFSIYL